MVKSKLPNNILGRIWKLSDVDKVKVIHIHWSPAIRTTDTEVTRTLNVRISESARMVNRARGPGNGTSTQ